MIINPKYRFIFVHIPKNAGSVIRKSLYDYGKYNFYDKILEHPELGLIDFAHIPLKSLKKNFPADYRKFESFWSFAIIRNPYHRFSSSIAQHLNMYSKKNSKYLSVHQMKKEIDNAINFLEKYPQTQLTLPLEYIHFQKQVDYIFVDQKKIIQTIVTTQKLDILEKEFFKQTGNKINLTNKDPVNQNLVCKFDNVLANNLIKLNNIIFKVILGRSSNLKKIINSYFFIPGSKKYHQLYESQYVKNFIESYYKEDLDFFNLINSNLNNI